MCKSTSKIVLVFISFLLSACSHLDLKDRTVEGVVNIDEHGFGVVSECSTNKQYQFGVMASVQYINFRNRYDDLSINGAVMVKVFVENTSSNIKKRQILLL